MNAETRTYRALKIPGIFFGYKNVPGKSTDVLRTVQLCVGCFCCRSVAAEKNNNLFLAQLSIEATISQRFVRRTPVFLTGTFLYPEHGAVQ